MNPTNNEQPVEGQVQGLDEQHGSDFAGNEQAKNESPVTEEPKKESPTTEDEPDMKVKLQEIESKLEQSERRRQGQDRLISQLRRSKETQSSREYASEDEAVQAELQDLKLFKAKTELQRETKSILKDFDNIPKAIKRQIVANPRGWINESTSTVDDAVIDIQELAAKLEDDFVTRNKSSNANPSGNPQITVAAPNASISSSGKSDLASLSSKDLDAKLASGEITMDDVEAEVRRLGRERANKS